jgi:hypothetical protein
MKIHIYSHFGKKQKCCTQSNFIKFFVSFLSKSLIKLYFNFLTNRPCFKKELYKTKVEKFPAEIALLWLFFLFGFVSKIPAEIALLWLFSFYLVLFQHI